MVHPIKAFFTIINTGEGIKSLHGSYELYLS